MHAFTHLSVPRTCFFFCQQKLVLCHSNHFRGVYLEKCETTESKVCFKESKNIGHFDLDTAVAVLISTLTVNSSFVEVDKMKLMKF